MNTEHTVLYRMKVNSSIYFVSPRVMYPLKIVFIPNDTRNRKLHTNACFAQPAYVEHVISVLESVYCVHPAKLVCVLMPCVAGHQGAWSRILRRNTPIRVHLSIHKIKGLKTRSKKWVRFRLTGQPDSFVAPQDLAS
jgi:hypothetical protein